MTSDTTETPEKGGTEERQTPALEQRLARLERENRGLKVMAIAALVLAAAALGWRLLPMGSRTLEARAFILRDSDGAKRAEIAVNSEGLGGLWLFDRAGKFRGTFLASPAGVPGIVFYDDNGRNRAEFALLPDNSPGLALSEEGGIASVGLLVARDGVPHFRLVDKTGKALVNVP